MNLAQPAAGHLGEKAQPPYSLGNDTLPPHIAEALMQQVEAGGAQIGTFGAGVVTPPAMLLASRERRLTYGQLCGMFEASGQRAAVYAFRKDLGGANPFRSPGKWEGFFGGNPGRVGDSIEINWKNFEVLGQDEQPLKQVTAHRYRRASAEMVHLSNLKDFTAQGQQQVQGGQQQQHEDGVAAGVLNPAAAAGQVVAGQAVAGPWAAAGAVQPAHQQAPAAEVFAAQPQPLPQQLQQLWEPAEVGLLAPQPPQLLQPGQAQGQEQQQPIFEQLPGIFGEQQQQQDAFGAAQELDLGLGTQLSLSDSVGQELSRLFKDPFTIDLGLGSSLSSAGAGLDAGAGAADEVDAVRQGDDADDKFLEMCARITQPASSLGQHSHKREAEPGHGMPAAQRRRDSGQAEAAKEVPMPRGIKPGAVIGLRGSRVHAIADHSGARVHVVCDKRAVQLSGSQEAVELAEQLLTRLFLIELEQKSVAVRPPMRAFIVLGDELCAGAQFCKHEHDWLSFPIHQRSMPADVYKLSPAVVHPLLAQRTLHLLEAAAASSAAVAAAPSAGTAAVLSAGGALAPAAAEVKANVFISEQDAPAVIHQLVSLEAEAAWADMGGSSSSSLKLRANVLGLQTFGDPYPMDLSFPLWAWRALPMEWLNRLKVPGQMRTHFINTLPHDVAIRVGDLLSSPSSPLRGCFALRQTLHKSAISLHLSARPRGSFPGERVVLSFSQADNEDGSLQPVKIKSANTKPLFFAFHHSDGHPDFRLKMLRHTDFPQGSPEELHWTLWELARSCQMIGGQFRMEKRFEKDWMIDTLRIKDKTVYEGSILVGADAAAGQATLRVAVSCVRQGGGNPHWEIPASCPELDAALRGGSSAGGTEGASASGGSAAGSGGPSLDDYTDAVLSFCRELRKHIDV